MISISLPDKVGLVKIQFYSFPNKSVGIVEAEAAMFEVTERKVTPGMGGTDPK